jgi:hypothetical protein
MEPPETPGRFTPPPTAEQLADADRTSRAERHR